ncbi:MAG: hypothetical protein Hyperionvirus6_26 [Hyperionvirus sp.]|uniref:Uncharacterized protein n=1 Tax=Hyperionvirus sp. TaxID=2487770 RepID=A0A3G5A7Y6_9VIRU|nr:MAG: hypothetical protein Hyperionvirus6_26 [Hyperionvirus sp.]
MAASESLDGTPLTYTVKWNARGRIIDVVRGSALRCDSYRAYEEGPFEKKEPFFVDWEEKDVHEVLNLIRDTQGLIRVDLSKQPATLAAHLMIDVARYERFEAQDEMPYLPILRKVSTEIMLNPEKYSYHTIIPDCPVLHSCESLIPSTVSRAKLWEYSSFVDLTIFGWQWIYLKNSQKLCMRTLPTKK